VDDQEFDQVFKALQAIPNVESLLCEGISRAVDEVVDPIRSARWSVDELSKPEKTIIGTRVENILRIDLELPRAKRLDVIVDGVNVDIKFTINENWTIPPEAMDQLCILTRFESKTNAASAGLLRIKDELLNKSVNRDKKRTLNANGRSNVRWLISARRPIHSQVAFLSQIDEQTKQSITDTGVGAQERLNRLFLKFKYVPIPETVVQAIAAGHVDWQRRLRPDKQNRKAPERLGYEVLRSTSPDDRKRIRAMELPTLPKGYCLAIDADADNA
jgi:hypothetical protein